MITMMITLQFLAHEYDALEFIKDLRGCVETVSETRNASNLIKYKITLSGDYSDIQSDIAVFNLGQLEALRVAQNSEPEIGQKPPAKRISFKNGARYKFIRPGSKPAKLGYSDLSSSIERAIASDISLLGSRFGFRAEIEILEYTAYKECYALVAGQDNLGALIKARSLDFVEKETIIAICSDSAQKANEKISVAVARLPKWQMKRKHRNVQRRLLRAILYRETGLSLSASKGMKFKALFNLAKNKTLI